MNPTIKIDIKEVETLQELEQKVREGYRFITFQYCVSFIAVTQRRFSKAHLINNPNDVKNYSKKYNLVSSFLGWWGIPWGPIYTFKSFEVNKKGGIDMTEDIMLNINEKNLKTGEIELTKTSQLFCKPDKWSLKAFRKSILRDFEFDSNVENIVVGVYINTDNNTAPFLTVGLKVKGDKFQEYLEPVKKSLSKEFVKHAYFEFIDLNTNNDLTETFLDQGEIIK
jgi:hypothetical protein